MANTIYCGLCLREIPAEDIAANRHTYSAWTGNRYCAAEDCRDVRAKLIKTGKVDPKERPGKRKSNRLFDFEAANRHKEKKRVIRRKGLGDGNNT